VGAYQLAIAAGPLIAAVVGNGSKDRAESGSCHIPIAVQFAWTLILGIWLIFLSETPRYFIKIGKDEKAAQYLARLRRLHVDNPYLAEELREMKANSKHKLSTGKSSYRRSLTWHTLGKSFMTAASCRACNNLQA
jgi:SP family sugar:H+ symporter-like MFS transporter